MGAREDNRLPVHKDEWQFFIAPYIWVPGANINTTFLNHTTSVSEGWWEIIPKLFSSAIGGMGRFEAWKGRWGFFVDSYFTYISGNVNDSAGKQIDRGRRLPIPFAIPVTVTLNGEVKYITRAGNVDFGPRYLVGTLPLSAERPLPVLSLELLGGGRYNVYSQYLKLNLDTTRIGPFDQLARINERSLVNKFVRSYIEPFLGIRLSLWLTPKSVVTYRGTLGGFGFAADNNLDSDMELAFGYKVHRNIYVYAAYRARYESASRKEIDFNGWLHGPALGAVFAF